MMSLPWVRYLTRHVVLAYIAVMLIVPATLILWRTFKPGFGQFYDWVSTPAARSALNLSLLVLAIVLPLNVIFGISTSLLLARKRFRGKAVLQTILDLPFSVSPIIVGFMTQRIKAGGGDVGVGQAGDVVGAHHRGARLVIVDALGDVVALEPLHVVAGEQEAFGEGVAGGLAADDVGAPKGRCGSGGDACVGRGGGTPYSRRSRSVSASISACFHRR